jgi:BlaI family transcriptional regulator, penicillinase repressor
VKKNPLSQLARRERQIMDVIYARGQATVAEVLDDLADPPTYSTVRAMLGKLEKKGFVKHEEHGPRYVYLPTLARHKASATALERTVQTFFDGSATKAMAALLDENAFDITNEEMDRMADLIQAARKRGR